MSRVFLVALLLLAIPAEAEILQWFDYKPIPCVADGHEHMIDGYAFFGARPWQMRAVSVTPSQDKPTRIQIRTATFLAGEIPNNTILATVDTDGGGIIQGLNIEWPAGVSTGLYCIATGGGVQQVKVRVYYEVYP